MKNSTRRTRTCAAIVLAGCLGTATIAPAQTVQLPLATDARPPTVLRPRLGDVWRPTTLGDSARAMSATLNAQSSTPTPPPPKNGCINKLAVGAVLGAGVGLGGTYLLLVSSHGSDSATEILRGGAILGGVLGLVGGMMACG